MLNRPQSDNHPFTQIKARYLFLWLLIFYLGFSVIYGVIASLFAPVANFEVPIVSHIIYFLSLLSLCCYLLRKLRQFQINPQYIMGNLYPSYPWLSLMGLTVILLLFSVGVALLSLYFLSLVAPGFSESLMESVSKPDSHSSSIIYKCLESINYIVVAPIAEEFIFRGVLLHRLGTKWNISAGVWISSIIFGCFHPNPIGISMLGVVWALLYIQTRTLVIPIIAHMMNNTIVVLEQLLAALIVEDNGVTESATDIDINDYSWKMGLFLVILSVPFLLRFIYQKFPSKNQSLPYFANQARAISSE